MRYVFSIVILAFQAYSADVATYLGNQYQVEAVATDLAGNTYVTGDQNLLSNSDPPSNMFVAKLDPAGNIVFTTTLGPACFPGPCPIALDSAGNVWVGYSPGLVKLSPNGNVISSVNFPGAVYGIAIDPNNNLYLTGRTVSNTFPTTPGLPNDSAELNVGLGGAAGAFTTKLDPTGSKFIYSAVIAAFPNYCSGGRHLLPVDGRDGGGRHHARCSG